MLSTDLLILLRQWWTLGRQQGVMHRDGWLFPGQHALKPISTCQLHRIVVDAAAHAGHLSLHQLKVMTAIETCRTAALGGHIDECGFVRIAYNSCRNRHCPKCQGAAARTWWAEREADLLPVGYFLVVLTLQAEIAVIAFGNKAVVYDLLFKTAPIPRYGARR